MATQSPIQQAEWDELKLARMTYPTLTIDDQGSWLGLERVRYRPPMMQGYFTFRLVSNKFGPSLQDHVERGRSHVLSSMTMNAREGGKDVEKIISLFLVDLRKAILRFDMGRKKLNTYGEEYVQFDPLTPGVHLFAERLRLP